MKKSTRSTLKSQRSKSTLGQSTSCQSQRSTSIGLTCCWCGSRAVLDLGLMWRDILEIDTWQGLSTRRVTMRDYSNLWFRTQKSLHISQFINGDKTHNSSFVKRKYFENKRRMLVNSRLDILLSTHAFLEKGNYKIIAQIVPHSFYIFYIFC